MNHERIKKAELKKKSEDLGIPFSSILAGYIVEEFMYLVSDSEFSKNLWLKNEDVFEIGGYQENFYLTLDFIYHTEEKIVKTDKLVAGQKLSKELAELMLQNIFVKEKTKGIRWKWNYQWIDEQLKVQVTAEYEEMKVPFSVEVRPHYLHGITPEKRMRKLFMHENEEIEYRHYPAETILAEQLLEIVTYLELVSSMKCYDIAYRIISKEPVDGRRIKDTLTLLCEENGISRTEDRGSMIAGYKDYGYMAKRWEKYAKPLRKEKNSNVVIPTWQELMERLNRFLTPIWNCISRDEIFFGDWMPELGRYLD